MQAAGWLRVEPEGQSPVALPFLYLVSCILLHLTLILEHKEKHRMRAGHLSLVIIFADMLYSSSPEVPRGANPL